MIALMARTRSVSRRRSRRRWLLEVGATAVEYALIVALIAGATIVSVSTLGTQTQDAFGCVGDSIEFVGPECEEDPVKVATGGKRKRKKRG